MILEIYIDIRSGAAYWQHPITGKRLECEIQAALDEALKGGWSVYFTSRESPYLHQ